VVAARVMGLDDPTVKMSKSLAHIRGHAIRLEDDPKEIERAFRRAVTDSGNEIRFSEAPEKAGVNNLLEIYQAVTGKSQAEVEADFADARGYGDLKKGVAEVTIAEVTPVRERYDYLMRDPAELDRLLAIGAEQAAAIAAPKLKKMKEIMGLVLPR
jgi:tryptophanyl-tRNA synthetase